MIPVVHRLPLAVEERSFDEFDDHLPHVFAATGLGCLRDAADLAKEPFTELLRHQMLHPADVAYTALPGIHLFERTACG